MKNLSFLFCFMIVGCSSLQFQPQDPKAMAALLSIVSFPDTQQGWNDAGLTLYNMVGSEMIRFQEAARNGQISNKWAGISTIAAGGLTSLAVGTLKTDKDKAGVGLAGGIATLVLGFWSSMSSSLSDEKIKMLTAITDAQINYVSANKSDAQSAEKAYKTFQQELMKVQKDYPTLFPFIAFPK